MSWDETLFKIALRTWRALRRGPRHKAEEACQARLSDLHTHLTLVARALSGAPLELYEAEGVGGFSGDILYLPGSLALAPTPDENAHAYLYRIAYTVTSRQLGCTLSGTEALAPDFQTFCTLMAVPPTLQALETTLPLTRAWRQTFFPLLLNMRPPCTTRDTVSACLEALTQMILGRDLPESDTTDGAQWLRRCVATVTASNGAAQRDRLWAQLLAGVRRTPASSVAPVLLWGQLLPAASSRGPHATTDIPSLTQASCPNATEIAGKPKEYVHQVTLDARDIENDVLIHTFEKMQTAEKFSGITRTPDGADELAQHADALDELDLRDVIRSPTPTQSLYRADLILDTGVGDLEAAAVPDSAAVVYDEWDGKARQYKPNWCTVYFSHPPPPPPQALTHAATLLRQHARVVRDLRVLLEKLRCQHVLRNRQPEGSDIDLDAVVDRYATVRSGHQPDDRLYLARRRHSRDLVTLLLIDMSYSTDAWLQGTRVLDIAKASALVLGEVLTQWQDRVGIAGFYSHTRRDCRFMMLKPFGTPWECCKAALAALEPIGYTRIGPAVRHGTALLQPERAAKKLLLLLSDGKPTDYDHYEGRYGIADVRQAIREAQQARIHTYALAIDTQAKLYLPQMFGSGHFCILPHPTQLVWGLTELYSRLAR